MDKIPSKLDHIKMLASISEHNRRVSASKLDSFNGELSVLGIALSILYQAATCHRRCFGGPHILESLSGRAYNLASSSYILICRGFYDEALNLMRSMGEIANLIALSVVDKSALRKWLEADTKTRLNEFSPFKIRMLLENDNSIPMYATKDWYSEFCENYTHINPSTRPNAHNEFNQAFVGGAVQKDGMKHAIIELKNVSAYIALFVAQYVDLDDLFLELTEEISGAASNYTDN